MPERKTMRRIRDCLRLHFDNGLSQKAISKVLSVARSTVWDYLQRARHSGRQWSELRELPDGQLEGLLFRVTQQSGSSRPLPDWNYVHHELHSHSYVTLQILWEEYRRTHADGYSYVRFCVRYRKWAIRHKVYMRQRHIGGQKLFVDYSGKRPRIRDAHSGKEREVELLVMCWGASHYIYAEAQESQQLPDWIMGHLRGYEYFGCAPHIEIDDNLKSAVSKACRYDPDTNVTFTEFAQHYGVAIIPARPRKPKDKAKVENAVLVAQRWILASLRHRTFYSLSELNRAIAKLLEKLNDKPMQRLPKSRRELFNELDKPNALPLPAQPFEYREWAFPTVGFDYHIQVAGNFYSVPWTLARQVVGVRLTATAVEVLHKHKRVALHQRSFGKYQYVTHHGHMPPAHQKHLQWTPGRIYAWAGRIGPSTLSLVQKVIKSKFHPQQGFRPVMGILRLSKVYGEQRLEAAARIALDFDFVRLQQISDVLKHGRDKLPRQVPVLTVANTANVRGRGYYAACERHSHQPTLNKGQ